MWGLRVLGFRGCQGFAFGSEASGVLLVRIKINANVLGEGMP